MFLFKVLKNHKRLIAGHLESRGIGRSWLPWRCVPDVGFVDGRIVTRTRTVGSGINFQRKGLRTLLGEAQRGRVRQIVVAHRDRLCRFAFDLVEWILTQGGATLLVQNGKQDLQHEFSEDLMAIVHVFSCRFNGMRRYKRTRGKGKSRDTPAESKTVSHRSSDNTIETVDGSQSVVIQPSGVCA